MEGYLEGYEREDGYPCYVAHIYFDVLSLPPLSNHHFYLSTAVRSLFIPFHNNIQYALQISSFSHLKNVR